MGTLANVFALVIGFTGFLLFSGFLTFAWLVFCIGSNVNTYIFGTQCVGYVLNLNTWVGLGLVALAAVVFLVTRRSR